MVAKRLNFSAKYSKLKKKKKQPYKSGFLSFPEFYVYSIVLLRAKCFLKARMALEYAALYALFSRITVKDKCSDRE